MRADTRASLPVALPIALLLALGTACAGDATAPTSHPGLSVASRAAPLEVPFRLRVTEGSSTAAFDGRCGPFPLLTVSIEAVAVATHLGRTSVRQSHCQNVFDPSGAFYDGEFTDTGSDGSSLRGTYAGTLMPTANPAQFLISGTFAITGGTGRHVGATGGGVASGLFDAGTGAVIGMTLEGTMSPPGRNAP